MPLGVTSGSANVGLRWGKVFPDNIPQIVDFPESHDPMFYLKGSIFLGQPPTHASQTLISRS